MWATVGSLFRPIYRKKYEGRYSHTPTAQFKGNYGALKGNVNVTKEKDIIARPADADKEELGEDNDFK